jgi:undecaprenyl pyrophosphate synthase
MDSSTHLHSNTPTLQLICDGNARWAAARGQPTEAGHSAGAQTLAQLVTACREYGIQALTVSSNQMPAWDLKLCLSSVDVGACVSNSAGMMAG